MRPAALVLLALATGLAGCAAPESLGFAAGEPAPREPFVREERVLVDGEHARDFDVPVEPGARLVNVSIALEPRTNGLPLPEASPARLHVALLGPDGGAIHGAILDARRTNATLLVEAPAAGPHAVAVRGWGFAPEVDGDPYGARYRLVVEVLYAG